LRGGERQIERHRETERDRERQKERERGCTARVRRRGGGGEIMPIDHSPLGIPIPGLGDWGSRVRG
jgi:hypothetical protein